MDGEREPGDEAAADFLNAFEVLSRDRQWSA